MPTRPPYASYATIVSVFGGLLGAAAVASKALGRDPQCQTSLDFAVLAAASFKAAHTLSHDEVTSFIRAPFVRGEAHTGEDEQPVQGGMPRRSESSSRAPGARARRPPPGSPRRRSSRPAPAGC